MRSTIIETHICKGIKSSVTDTKSQRSKALFRLTFWMIKIAIISKFGFNKCERARLMADG